MAEVGETARNGLAERLMRTITELKVDSGDQAYYPDD